MELVKPSLEHLPSYMHALVQGWSPDNLRPEAAQEELAGIEADPVKFIADQDDADGKGLPITLPDGRSVPRLPGYHRWMWDGEFCGSIGFRWQPDSTELPPYCLGHIGYSVVPWKRRRGYATRALALLLQARGVRRRGEPALSDLPRLIGVIEPLSPRPRPSPACRRATLRSPSPCLRHGRAARQSPSRVG